VSHELKDKIGYSKNYGLIHLQRFWINVPVSKKLPKNFVNWDSCDIFAQT
jgi:hypothetical protein